MKGVLDLDREPLIEARVDIECRNHEQNKRRDDREPKEDENELRSQARAQDLASALNKEFADVSEHQPDQRDQEDDVDVQEPEEENRVYEGKRARELSEAKLGQGQDK